MKYTEFKVTAYYGDKVLYKNIVAISIDSAIQDLTEAFGECDFYTWGIK